MRAREPAALWSINQIDEIRFSIFLVCGVALCGVASAQTSGKAIYDERCVQCHGIDGRGNGAAAPVLMPRPRDFAAAQFKLRTTETGSLPTDDDLIRTITYGVPGTSMPGWQKFLSTSDIAAVAAYIKSFSRASPSNVRKAFRPWRRRFPARPHRRRLPLARRSTRSCAARRATEQTGKERERLRPT
jgi:cytochrome c553